MTDIRRTCYIYLITDGHGNYKVGIAKKPFQRLKELNIGNPFKLHIAITARCSSVQNAVKIERFIHGELGKHRNTNGEWYSLSLFDLKALAVYFIENTIGDCEEAEDSESIYVKTQSKEKVEFDDNELSEKAKGVIMLENRASASLLQRKLKIGYARAARIIDLLETEGVISGPNGSNARRILPIA